MSEPLSTDPSTLHAELNELLRKRQRIADDLYIAPNTRQEGLRKVDDEIARRRRKIDVLAAAQN